MWHGGRSWRDKDNSQYEPTAEIDASNLLRAIREAGRDRGYRRYESKSERNEGTAEQHLSAKLERVLNGGWGIEGRGKKNRTLEVFYGKYNTPSHCEPSLAAEEYDGEGGDGSNRHEVLSV